MNIVVGMVVIVLSLLLVRPVQAANRLFVDSFIPAVLQTSLRIPVLGESSFRLQSTISAVDGSNVQGTATLTSIDKNLDTKIGMKVSGLEAGEQYVPIYYQNDNCETEVDSFDKSIEGAFFAGENGEGEVEDIVKDSTNRIGSVSIRKAENFDLVACGRV